MTDTTDTTPGPSTWMLDFEAHAPELGLPHGGGRFAGTVTGIESKAQAAQLAVALLRGNVAGLRAQAGYSSACVDYGAVLGEHPLVKSTLLPVLADGTIMPQSYALTRASAL